MLIAVSSFGKGLRRYFLTEPAEAVLFNYGDEASGVRALVDRKLRLYYRSCIATGSTTVKVVPCPTTESTQIRPW